jgi:hypothetical protein
MKRIKYTKELLEPIASKSLSFSDVMKKLGLKESQGSRETLKKKMSLFEIDTHHFLGCSHMKGKHSANRLPWQKVLVLRKNTREDAFRLRRALIESGVEYICKICKQPPTWMNKELRLNVDHIDGNRLDCRKHNVRFLCPHCHSQTEGFCGSMGLTDIDNVNRYKTEWIKHGNRRKHI